MNMKKLEYILLGLLVGFAMGACSSDDENAGVGAFFADMRDDLQAVPVRHGQIEQQQIRTAGHGHVYGFKTVSSFTDDFQPFSQQKKLFQATAKQGVILRDNDGYGHGAPPSVPLLDKPKSFPKQYGVYPSFLRCGPDCPGELSSVMCSMIELPCTVFHKEAH